MSKYHPWCLKATGCLRRLLLCLDEWLLPVLAAIFAILVWLVDGG